MKSISRIILTASLLVGGMLVAGSCTKEGGLFERAGQQIRFGTLSPGATTKTEYAGKDNDADKIEPIWWKAGDEVRIVSGDSHVTDNPALHYADYVFKSFVGNDKTKATLSNKGNNGLAWGDVVEPYTFYAVYPATVNIGYESGNLGKIQAEIPAAQAVTAHEYTAAENGTAKDWYTVVDGKYTVYEPEMSYAFMTAKSEFTPTEANFDANRYIFKNGETNGPEVPLTFTPAFTAFEFTFESADPDVDINLTEFRMESTSTALAGIFTGTAGSESFDAVTTASKTLSLSNPAALGTIKNGAPKSFTVFAIPNTITDLTIYFADKDSENNTRTRKLVVTDKTTGDPISFAPGKKYRIKGIKLPGNQYQFFLTLNGVVQDWVAVELETSFSEQIQCGALTFDKSAREMTDEYKNANGGKTNHYATSPIGDGRWQVRTLNNTGMDGETYEYMTVKFTPTAPLGGYWKLDTHGNTYFKVELVTESASALEPPTVTPLPEYGRIMNQTVTLRITPLWTAITGASESEEIGLYMDCYFSANIDFDPILDANTEFQDIHGAGTYSYWLITVAR
ncbi:MAG: fimbrillin family protein [Bacteroidales bacterium]|nr:fimbrillin family protein [Bacteroidales bacterium]